VLKLIKASKEFILFGKNLASIHWHGSLSLKLISQMTLSFCLNFVLQELNKKIKPSGNYFSWNIRCCLF